MVNVYYYSNTKS